MDDHLSNDPPTDDTMQLWLREDARLILQIRNSIDSEILGLINHCEFVKELMDYLEFLYYGKGNISRIYDVCRAFYRPEKETKTLTAFFMDFEKTYEELKVQQAQRYQSTAGSKGTNGEETEEVETEGVIMEEQVRLCAIIAKSPDTQSVADLITKQTIGKGHVYDGLYILDAWVPRSVACFGVVSPFEAHCRLGHPYLPVLKKLCPQFHDISSVDYAVQQTIYRRSERMYPRVNALAAAFSALAIAKPKFEITSALVISTPTTVVYQTDETLSPLLALSISSFSNVEPHRNHTGVTMTTVEKLFVQIFERKNSIVEQVKQQTDLYSQHLASKLLVDGIAPPPWLWNPNPHSQHSDPKELNKEELISELLLPQPRPKVPYSSGFGFLYNIPVFTENNQELPDGLCMEAHASNHIPHADDGPTTVPDCRNDDMGCALNCVPEQEFSVTSPQDQTEVQISNIYSAADHSLAKIQRSKSRQKALKLRNSANASDEGGMRGENRMIFSLSGNLSFQPVDHVNELSTLAKTSSMNALREAKRGDQSNENASSNYSGRITRSRTFCHQSNYVNSSFKLDRSPETAKNDGRAVTQSKDHSQQHPNHVNEVMEVVNRPDVTGENHGVQEATTGNWGDEEEGREVCCSRLAPLSSYTPTSENDYSNLEASLGAAKADNGMLAQSIGRKTRSQTKDPYHINEVMDVVNRPDVTGENHGVQEAKTGHWRDEEKGRNVHCSRLAQYSGSMPTSANEFSKLEASLENAKVDSGMLAQSIGKQLDDAIELPEVIKPFGEPVGRKRRSQTICSTAVKSKPVVSSSHPVIRSRSCVSEGFSLENSLNGSKGDAPQDTLGSQVAAPSANRCVMSNQEGSTETVVATEPVIDGPVQAHPLCPRSTSNGAFRRIGSESLLSRPPSYSRIVVKPKQLDFYDLEECNLEISSSPPHKKRLKRSFEIACSTSLEPAASLSKVTSDNPSTTFVEQSLVEGKVSIQAESDRTEANLECVEDEINKHGNDINNSLVLHDANVALDVQKSSDVEMYQVKYHLTKGCQYSAELQTEEGLGLEERNKDAASSSMFERKQLGQYNSSSLTKVADGESEGCLVEDVGPANQASNILDPRRWNGQDNERFLHDDLTHTERTLRQRKSYLSESESPLSDHSGGSSYNDELGLSGPDGTLPVFEGFILDVQNENGGLGDVGDGINFGKLDHPSTTVECNSILEQIGRSLSMNTPQSHFLSTLKMHGNQDLYQSVPNGLLEHVDMRSMWSLNGGANNSTNYRYVNRDKSAFKGLPYSDCLPYSCAQFGWNSRNPYTSPVGNFWERLSLKSSSSEKRLSFNPDLTCFPIEEDPITSEESENADEEADKVKEGIDLKAINSLENRELHAELTEACLNPPPSVSAAEKLPDRGSLYSTRTCDNREPLAEITEVCLNPSASLSTAQNIPDRSSLDSVNTDGTGTYNKVKRTLRSNHLNKRSMNEGKENQTLSIGANGFKKANASLPNRKPKLSSKTSLMRGGQRLLEKESKCNNIVSNISSFIPLVQQKQAAAVCTEKHMPDEHFVILDLNVSWNFLSCLAGKRDIKVRALEAAEAAKRREEQKENARKLKKQVLQLERARVEQENLKQKELNKKKKEEEQKKKDENVIARKRLREEEERKEKERKRKRIEEVRRPQKLQEEKLRARKLEKEKQRGNMDEKFNSRKESANGSGEHQKLAKANGGDNNLKMAETELKVAGTLRNEQRQAYTVIENHVDNQKEMSMLEKSAPNGDTVTETSMEKSYDISPYQCSDDEEDEEGDLPTQKFIPSWASKNNVSLALSLQMVDPDVIFPRDSFCSMDEGLSSMADFGTCQLIVKHILPSDLMPLKSQLDFKFERRHLSVALWLSF
ncbi:hypothetical protein RJ640_004857 [Escallonia rubra]|uniref:Inner centromere protein ARK-binding domain-containing protein n=1 Tax=Escallonia rubra TaxID=112253 RepID=A0AA88U3H0_9ASTE|nr:hypothetical protein RJ640_004857 [Escallonia rubra]